MNRILFLLAVLLCCGCQNQTQVSDSQADQSNDAQSAESKTRTFKFVYGAALTELEPGTDVRVWLPVAASNHDQTVELLETNLPGDHQRTTEKKFGNELIYFEAKANDAGEVPIEVTYLVTRRELTDANYETATDEGTTFLKASSMVPTGDELRSAVLGDATVEGAPIEVARQLYDGVENHMKYDKPSDKPGWGNGDAEWACNNGFGNCTDFHSLFISSARNLKIPARFEIGFPIPTEIGKGEVGGYHCWAKFLSEEKWVPVDISEADKNPELKEYYFGNLTPDRVTFSIGRDLQLMPAPAAETVNYLSYPYAEVDGKQHKKFRKAFAYEDVAEE
jgi:transglutaminase-like putative cysteine protease